MQDPSIVATLLLSNSGDMLSSNSVNTYNAHLLQSSASITDYCMKINLPLQQQNILNNSDKSQQHQTTKKLQLPCRYYNTSRGCKNGNKCPFGHFGQGIINASGSGMNSNRGITGGGSGNDANSVASAAAVAAAVTSALIHWCE